MGGAANILHLQTRDKSLTNVNQHAVTYGSTEYIQMPMPTLVLPGVMGGAAAERWLGNRKLPPGAAAGGAKS